LGVDAVVVLLQPATFSTVTFGLPLESTPSMNTCRNPHNSDWRLVDAGRKLNPNLRIIVDRHGGDAGPGGDDSARDQWIPQPRVDLERKDAQIEHILVPWLVNKTLGCRAGVRRSGGQD
jgi:hypothetical protein